MYAFNEVKGQLARLLATENLIVENRKVDTASFDVLNRILVLPLWERAEGVVYDLLVSHEVGHALYTPQDDWKVTYPSLPQSYLNITEDARVEKLMKRRYAGLTKTFFNGYKLLSQQDFFEIGEDDVSTYSFIDRINLYFKIGNFISLSFTEEEKVYVEKVRDTETFDEALKVADEIYKYVNSKKKESVEMPAPQQTQEGSDGGDNPTQQSSDEQGDGESEDTDDAQSVQQSEDMETSENFEGGGFHGVEEVKTDETFAKNISNLNSKFDSKSPIYMEIPKINLDNVVVSNSKIYDVLFEYWKQEQEQRAEYCSNIFEAVDADFAKFKKSAQKEVNYLVKEFECRKSADAYARATTSRTGVLDTTKLHTYRYNEDLFKKVTVLPQGKNHGLIFVLDWSGSMASQLLETLKQMYNLLWFCKKCQIPFDVYAFTNEWKIRTFEREIFKDMTPVDEVKANQFSICEEFNMLNLFTSKVKTAELNEQMKAIYRIAHTFSNKFSGYYSYPYALSLSGTPLNEALVCLDAIIPQFKQKNKMQKVHCIVLTDGEAQVSRINTIVQAPWEAESRMGMRAISDRVILRNRKNGNTYTFDYGWQTHTKTFNRYLKDQFPEVNMIGIRVCSTRDFGSFLRVALGYSDEYNKVLSDWKKTRAVSFDGFGYSKQFAIASNALAQDSEFDVDEGATKTKIKSAFIKSLKTKKMNKKILSEFISMVA